MYDLAIDKGMKVAALLWPVTGKSRIQYNLPEIFANRPWQNQVMVSLLNGSPLYQLELNKRFGKLLNGRKQPNLDDFLHQSLLYTIKNKRPELVLVHYTDLDWARHFNGFGSIEAAAALERHDKRLGDIIDTLRKEKMYEDSTIAVLGDHSSLDEDKIICINALFREKGYIKLDQKHRITEWSVIAKNCDGSAYIYLRENRDKTLMDEVYDLLYSFNKAYDCIENILTAEEASQMGADPSCAYMLEAAKGCYFLDDYEGEIVKKVDPAQAGIVPHITVNTHGYSPCKKDYTTVFMVSGRGIRSSIEIEEMKLIDEAPTFARLLGLNLLADGSVLTALLE